jgi:branched-chain amino acid transport system ATP-binding protein
MEINRGEIVGVIGANGAGKTTLLKSISGLLPLAAGEIYFQGLRLSSMPAHKRVERGLVQVPEGRRLFPNMTVLENLEIASFSSRAGKERDKNLAKVFQLFPRLYERKNQLAKTLSGGEQQMVAIGRSLMAEPELLLLDEPSMGLAPIIVNQLFDIIKEIHKSGATILLVEQNVQKTFEIVGRVYVMENGRVTIEGKPDNLIDNPHLREAYLGV